MKSLSLFTAAFLSYLSTARCDLALFENSDGFDAGEYSSTPVQEFVSSPLLSVPRFNILASHPICMNDGNFIFFSPRGRTPKQPGPMIVDSQGHLVWTDPRYPVVYNLRPQKYNGANVLTFWRGNDQVRGHGSGDYVVLNDKYEEIATIAAGNGQAGDLHEFLFTDEGTALVTIYENRPADLSKVGREGPSWIWDSLFQEIELESKKVLFEWRASDWFDFSDSYYSVHDYGAEDNAWDFFHINSVDKDWHGNYLISSRYTHSAIYIDRKTGAPVWHLGGKNNSFTDLSSGLATTFAGQHDARWLNDYKEVTLFDNGADYDTRTSDYSRAVHLAVDTVNMTARLIQEYISPSRILAESQGSAQMLPNGNMLVGFGFVGAWTEFGPQGNVLCDVEFEAATAFLSGDIQSYRTLKFPWVGRPATKPDFVVNATTHRAYMSWNGATEVGSWTIMHARFENATNFCAVGSTARTGFESRVQLDRKKLKRFVKAVAMDKSGRPLGESLIIDLQQHLGGEFVQYDIPSHGWFLAGIAVLLFAYFAKSSWTRPARASWISIHKRTSSRLGLMTLPKYVSLADEERMEVSQVPK